MQFWPTLKFHEPSLKSKSVVVKCHRKNERTLVLACWLYHSLFYYFTMQTNFVNAHAFTLNTTVLPDFQKFQKMSEILYLRIANELLKTFLQFSPVTQI